MCPFSRIQFTTQIKKQQHQKLWRKHFLRIMRFVWEVVCTNAYMWMSSTLTFKYNHMFAESLFSPKFLVQLKKNSALETLILQCSLWPYRHAGAVHCLPCIPSFSRPSLIPQSLYLWRQPCHLLIIWLQALALGSWTDESEREKEKRRKTPCASGRGSWFETSGNHQRVKRGCGYLLYLTL